MLLEQLDRYKLDVTVIQEMRWIVEGVIEKKNHIFFTVVKGKTTYLGQALL
jgi:hypothetical protein